APVRTPVGMANYVVKHVSDPSKKELPPEGFRGRMYSYSRRFFTKKVATLWEEQIHAWYTDRNTATNMNRPSTPRPARRTHGSTTDNGPGNRCIPPAPDPGRIRGTGNEGVRRGLPGTAGRPEGDGHPPGRPPPAEDLRQVQDRVHDQGAQVPEPREGDPV